MSAPSSPPQPWVRRPATTIYTGQVLASKEPAIIKTTVGSCIAACFWDPEARVGGMNHFLLPRPSPGAEDIARFGVHAMDLLMCEMIKAGADRDRIVAKIFGGAHVLDIEESETSVPRLNVAFIREFLGRDGFTVAAEDVGGHRPRHLRLETDTGRVFVRHVDSARMMAELVRNERTQQTEAPAYGDVTLFS